MANVVGLPTSKEKRGLTPDQWWEALYGFQGAEYLPPADDRCYVCDVYLEGITYRIHFDSEYPDGTYSGFGFYYYVKLRETPELASVNEFNQAICTAQCVVDEDSLRFHWYVAIDNTQLTETLFKHQILRWMRSLPAITAFAHRYGD